ARSSPGARHHRTRLTNTPANQFFRLISNLPLAVAPGLRSGLGTPVESTQLQKPEPSCECFRSARQHLAVGLAPAFVVPVRFCFFLFPARFWRSFVTSGLPEMFQLSPPRPSQIAPTTIRFGARREGEVG